MGKNDNREGYENFEKFKSLVERMEAREVHE